MRTLLIAVFIAALVAPAFADWDEGTPAKWVQLPDLSFAGIDVSASTGFILADDFLCTEEGYITDIHLWGSWYNDYLPFGESPASVRFTLSIHADIPASESPTGYSMPGDVLWVRTFQPETFTARVWAGGIEEGWLEPPDVYTFPADWTCWQYNFFIDPLEAFYQTGTAAEPVVYWLDVKAEPLDEQAFFGWKTSIDHWNDDAVWGIGSEPYLGPWYELIYPPQHPYYPQSIDLAFVITGETQGEEIDYGDAPDPTYPTLIASNGAGHVIVPGVQLGAQIDAEADGQPVPPGLGDDLNGFPDEDGVVFMAPIVAGQTVQYQVTASTPGFLDAWVDFYADGQWTGVDRIATQVALGAGINMLSFSVPNDATPGITYSRFRFSTTAVAGGLTPKGIALDGEVEDYELFIEPGEEYKWLQNPDLDQSGIDVNATEPYILADDWLCMEPGRIDEIHIWGSWLNDYYPNQELVPWQADFILSIHADIPAWENPDGYSIPGEELWVWGFPVGSYAVIPWAEHIEEGWLDPPAAYTFPADWTCWEYVFPIDPEAAFHQVGMPDSNVVYWLNVQVLPHDPLALFGWKTSLDHWNDDAVWGQGVEPYLGPWYDLRYPVGHVFEGQSIDLAFMLRSRYGTGVGDGVIYERFGLEQNVPNPFNPKTSITYTVPSDGGEVTIEVYDVTGRLVRTLVSGFVPAGRHLAVWTGVDAEGDDVASGVYFCRLTAGEETMTRKMLLLK